MDRITLDFEERTGTLVERVIFMEESGVFDYGRNVIFAEESGIFDGRNVILAEESGIFLW